MSEQVNKLKFQDKVAIVTGGIQGIGRAIVDILDEVGSKISYDGPGEIIYMHCDMTKDDEIKASIDETVQRLGKIDCVVNNVGVHPGFVSTGDMSVQGFRDLLSVNLVSYFAASKFALPHLRKTKGCIVNISSNVVVHSCRNSVTYTAAKPLGRIAKSEEMARACLYLVVDATFSTGTDLICTGGSDIGYGIKEFGAEF
ncbi:hypothetical protein ACF0H5_006422 [Mactra antiquata]